MANDTPLNSVSASLTAIEANIIIAGVEATLVGWYLCRTATTQSLIPELTSEWHWFFALYAIVGLLCVVIAGFILEGVSGLIETIITHRVLGAERGTMRKWYAAFTKAPVSWTPAQLWIWSSSEAYQEFSRRRLRILVARNTAFSLLFLTIGWLLLVSWSLTQFSFLWLSIGFLGAGIFIWLWFDAQKGWNMAVSSAEKIPYYSRPTKRSTGRANTARR